jgi:adenylate kinase family enzyme
LGLPRTELDALWWDPDWTEAGADEFQRRVAPVVAQDRWVLDGNYFSVGAGALIWPLADTIVWLDLPRWIAVPRVLRRSLVRGVRRTELWSGNRESVLRVLRPDSIVRFAWTAWPKYGERYRSLVNDPQFAHLTWVHLTSPSDVRRWLAVVG